MKEKVTGISGDGAFIRGNKGFKEKTSELLDKVLKFRWDILHLVNRAFEEARQKAGKGKAHSTLLLMEWVQNQSKTWRTGADYTKMVLDALGITVGFITWLCS